MLYFSIFGQVKAQADLEKELFDPCLNAFPELGSISGGFPGVSDIGVGDIGGGIPLPSSEITPADICRQTCNGNGKCVANTPVIRNDSSLRAPGIPSLANLFHCQCARDDCSTCSCISPIIPPADAVSHKFLIYKALSILVFTCVPIVRGKGLFLDQYALIFLPFLLTGYDRL